MSFWTCPEHGIGGPMGCCAKASRAEFAAETPQTTMTVSHFSPALPYGVQELAARRVHTVMMQGYEADDLLCTLALRAKDRTKVVVLSNDSDLLILTTAGVDVVRPQTGGEFQTMLAADVCEKYRIPSAHLLSDYKAMVGETGDNVPGVPGIGPKKASSLLCKLDSLENIILAGQGGYSKEAALVAQHAETARRALRLVSLRPDAPVPPIMPAACALRRRAA